MQYVLVITFDQSSPELAPDSVDVGELVRGVMESQYHESGYRSTSVYEAPGVDRFRKDVRQRSSTRTAS